MIRHFFILILLLISGFCFSQSLDQINKNLGFYNTVNDTRIRSVQLYKTGNTFAAPIIVLNRSETVTLAFDDIAQYGENTRDFYYTITHCDADWEDERLTPNDYMVGFPENEIFDVRQAIGTAIPFTYHSVSIPNEDVKLRISGNYLIRVFEIGSRKLVLQRGFSVVEQSVQVQTAVRHPMNNTPNAQQLELTLSYRTLRVDDPFTNLKVRVRQNFTPLRLADPVPAFVKMSTIEYTRPDRNIFAGGNEFRAFDIRNLNFNGQGVKGIGIKNDIFMVQLQTDENRANLRYMDLVDANGRFVIGLEKRSFDVNIQAEYANVLFSLKLPKPLENKRIFIFGELTNWSLNSEYEMTYNNDLQVYECASLVKQGYYNYEYVTLDNTGKIDTEELEGSFFDTENSYEIYVYYRFIGDRFDRLVGFERVNSRTGRMQW